MADAGQINAYDSEGSCMGLLKILKSEDIGQDIQYLVPDYNNREVDYILYTDKCGCQCCLNSENEFIIHTTQGVISGLTLEGDSENFAVIIKRSDIFGSNRTKSIVRYSTTDYPETITDGTLAVEELVKNQYSINGYSVNGLSNGVTYYFTIFAVEQDNTVIDVKSASITTDFIKRYISNSNTKVYIPMDVIQDKGPHRLSISNYNNVTVSSMSSARINICNFLTGTKYLSFPNIDNMSGAWTVSVWSNINQGTIEGQWLFTQGTGSTNRGLHLGYSTGTRGLTFAMYGNDVDTTSYEWQDGTWHNYTFTRNGSTGYAIYVDAVKVKSGTLSSGFQSGNNTGFIGNWFTDQSTRTFKGYMSEFFIETGQRSDSKVQQYVSETAPNYNLSFRDFQQVEYIQSSGTQRINTGYTQKANSGFDVRFYNVSFVGTYHTIIGGRTDTSTAAMWIGHDNTGKSYYELSPTNTTIQNDGGWSVIGATYRVRFNCGSIYGGNSIYRIKEGGSQSAASLASGFTKAGARPIYLFAGNSNGQTQPFEASAIKMYYCKIYEGNALVRDFVPCYRKSDGVIGLFDKIHGKFYTNAGTGTFTKGPNV